MIAIILLFLTQLLSQTNCVLEMTCLDWLDDGNFLGAWTLFEEWYGIPNAAVLGMFLGIAVSAIYVHTKSIAFLAVAGIYVLGMTSATFIADAYIAPQYTTIWYIIALAIASAVVVFVLKLIRE